MQHPMFSASRSTLVILKVDHYIQQAVIPIVQVCFEKVKISYHDNDVICPIDKSIIYEGN